MTVPVSRRRPVAAAAAAVLLAALGLALLAPSGEAAYSTGKCQGAKVLGRGASFAATAQVIWIANFSTNFCAGVGPAVTYDPAGSGAGLETMGVRRGSNATGANSRNQVARFGASDDPPTPTQIAQMNMGTDAPGDEAQVHVIPAAVGAVAPLVNFPNNCDVNLLGVGDKTAPQDKDGDSVDDDVVRVRFTKAKWEGAWAKDPSLDNWVELFPALAGDSDCNKPVIRVVRFDASGTTFAFKDYLSRINPGLGWTTTYESDPAAGNRAWPSAKFGARTDCDKSPSGPGSEDDAIDHLTSGCSNGNQGLVPKLIATDGSIGYSDIATARTAGLGIDPEANDNDTYWTQIQNGSSAFTEPTEDPDGFRTDGAKGSNCAATTFTGAPTSTRGDWSKTSGVNSSNGYGICTMTYGLVFDDNAAAWGVSAEEEAKARTVKDYWTSIVSGDGQTALFPNDYAPLPASMLTIAREGVNEIDWNKQGLGGGGGGNAPPPGGNNPSPPGPGPKPAPSNVFSVPSTKIDSKKGTAAFSIKLPGAGQLAVKGTNGKGKKRITVANLRRSVSKAGTVKITLTPGSKAMKALKSKGTLKVNVTITFTPQGGSARSSSKTVTLKYAPPKKGKGKGKS